MKKIIAMLCVLISSVEVSPHIAYEAIKRDGAIVTVTAATALALSHYIPLFLEKPKPEIPSTIVGLIKINGKIASNDERIAQTMYRFAHDPGIQAVLLVVDSGGGDMGVGELYFREIKALSASKPVIVMVESSCCSAAYYAAAGADWIIAPASATIGCIGVFITVEKHQNPKYRNSNSGYSADLSFDIIYAGKFKNAIIPNAGPLSDEARAFLQKNVNHHYDIFVEAVAQERGLSVETAKDWAEAQEFSGHQALEKGLIDQVGGYSDALLKMKELIVQRGGNVTGEFLFAE